jgi:hypothetical protein
MMPAILCGPLPLSAASAFVVGVAGSVHCLAMCGGVAGALGLRSRRMARPSSAWLHTAAYQAGRLASYALAGALVGAWSGLLQAMFDLSRLAVVARIVAGLILIGVAASILFHWRPLSRLERLGGRFFGLMRPLAGKVPADGLTGSLLLGMLWGFLPCGFIYSMLLLAALAGSATRAAAMMLCFGLGTVPAVCGAGALSAGLQRVTLARGVHSMAGWLLLAFGTLMVLGPLSHAHH